MRVGETDLSKEIDCNTSDDAEDCAEPYQDIPVDKFIKHEQYSASRKNNDIALIKLAKPARLNFSKYSIQYSQLNVSSFCLFHYSDVQPICLPFPELLRSTIPGNMIVSGWGVTEDRKNKSSKLRYALVPIVEPDQCRRSLRVLSDAVTMDEGQVCAGGGSDRADNCHGDSGGPLQYFGKQAVVIHGIVSWGQDSCGELNTPGVYTKVSHYLDWIINNLK